MSDTKPKRNLILMTGTPLTTPADSYGYCRFTNPTAYKSRTWFDAQHVGNRDHFENVIQWRNEDAMKENFLFNAARVFRREIDPDLPEVTYEPIVYELNPDHMRMYKQLAQEQLLQLEGQEITAMTVQKLNATLQQVIIGYPNFAPESARETAMKDTAGLQLLDEVMASLGERKLIVYAYYQAAINTLLTHCQKYQGVALYGGMSDKQREHSLNQFINNPDCRVLIGQPLSMGSGLDTLKDVCSDVLFLELPMVAKDFTQAVGRIDRNGQKQHCHVRVAAADGTLQMRRQKMLLDKDQVANEIQLTFKDLRDLIFGN